MPVEGTSQTAADDNFRGEDPEGCSDGKGATYSNHLNNFNLHTHSHRYQCFENRLFSPKSSFVLSSLLCPLPSQPTPALPHFHHGSSKV